MKADSIMLWEFMGAGKRVFSIPVYQRNYDWKQEHCENLFRDIENIVSEDYNIRHFLGTIVYMSGDSRPDMQEFIIIDGQQRITSMTLLLKAFYDLCDEQETKEEIYEDFLINKRMPEKFRMKLKPVKKDLTYYHDLISNDVEDFENINSNVIKNYSLFRKLIINSDYSVKMLFKAFKYIEIVYIALEQEKKYENPQLIFESLNSTGLDLLPADLIRNFLLINHSYEKQSNLYNNYWVKIENRLSSNLISELVRDYLTMKTGSIPSKENVYKNFKEYFNIQKEFDAEGILEQLLMYSKYYNWFYAGNTGNAIIDELLQELQILKTTSCYPALLYIFEDCYEYNIIDKNVLISILKLFNSYIYRRTVCDYPSNALNKIFSPIAKHLSDKQLNNVNYYDEICKYILYKTGKSTFPRDKEFEESFIVKNYYKTNLLKHTLYSIEKFNNKEFVSVNENEDITIEHIMPQTLSPIWRIDLGNKYEEVHNKYLHSIGNLTLTAYNGELSNKSFKEKKDI